MKDIQLSRIFLIKRIHRYLCVLLIFAFTGCESLDFPNPNSPTPDNVTVQSLVAGALAGMRVDYAIYLRAVGSVGREVYYFEPADPRYTRNLLVGNPDPGGFLVERPWAARYQVIGNCTLLLEKAAAELSGEERAGVEGFAKTIIAYQLLLNLNYMHDNGIKIVFSDDVNAPFVPREEGFNEIIRYLDEANGDLANAGSRFNFLLSDGFLGFNTPSAFAKFNRALRARVAVYTGDFDTALSILNTSGESFLDETAPLSLGVYHVYSASLNDQTNEIFEVPDAAFVKLLGHPSFETDAKPGDMRVSDKVFKRATPLTFDDLTSDLSVTITISSTDRLPIIRNEELILLRAEANIGKNQLSEANPDINLIRSVAGLTSLDLTQLTQAQALDSLLYEKRYSLFMEGHRWVDMRRYDKLNELPLDLPAHTHLVQMPRPETEEGG